MFLFPLYKSLYTKTQTHTRGHRPHTQCPGSGALIRPFYNEGAPVLQMRSWIRTIDDAFSRCILFAGVSIRASAQRAIGVGIGAWSFGPELGIVHIPHRYSTDIVPILRYPHLRPPPQFRTERERVRSPGRAFSITVKGGPIKTRSHRTRMPRLRARTSSAHSSKPDTDRAPRPRLRTHRLPEREVVAGAGHHPCCCHELAGL